MGKLDIAKKLEERRRRRPEIHQSMVSRIEYQAAIRRGHMNTNLRAERDRLRGALSRIGTRHPQSARDRYNELVKIVGESK